MWKTSDTEVQKKKTSIGEHLVLLQRNNQSQKVYEATKSKHFLWDYLLKQKYRFHIFLPSPNKPEQQTRSEFN